MNDLAKAAQYYKSLGFSVIPIGQNKKSIYYWKQYQHAIISDDKLECAFSQPNAFGIAIVCGAISGNLEIIDIDEKNDHQRGLFQKFIKSIKAYKPELLAKLLVASSQTGGYHFFYQCKEISNSLILARRSCTKDELAINKHQRAKILIETRGEGGYVIVYPTPGYRFIQHSLINIPAILPDERHNLHQIARSLNRYQDHPGPINRTPSVSYSPQISPFNDYDSRADIIALLERHGWRVVKTTGLKTYFQRPGDTDHETSGDFHHGLGLFSVCSTSTDFMPFTGYRPYAVYTILECNGNFKLAAKQLLAEGYGIPYKKVF